MTGCSRPKLSGMAALAATALGIGITPHAEGQQQAFVIQGGTLIDGNGSTPAPNSVIISHHGGWTRRTPPIILLPYAFSTESAHPSSVAEN